MGPAVSADCPRGLLAARPGPQEPVSHFMIEPSGHRDPRVAGFRGKQHPAFLRRGGLHWGHDLKLPDPHVRDR